ncbi:MAG TPA: PP2C family serine/threonine-protein phosphatase [Burkholderiaceae bacterium]|jgi:serine/threonine protein phosphatase PrpC|nr:PP2C family serine/threonine-protein phosphatase [Burkholderiaceae bacterium]
MMLAVRTAQRSCTGSREHNEDCVGVEHVGPHWCMVVSDGAGGHRDGALASRLVVDRVLGGFRSRPPTDSHDLGELILDAHDGIIAAQRARGITDRARAMHATAVVLLVDAGSGRALWGSVGDSRLYLLRDGRASALTRDDSVLQWMVDSGLWQPEQLKDHPQRNHLLAALGADERFEPHVSGDPFELRDRDAFLLCSDGWWHTLDEADLERLLGAAPTPEDWLEAMVACTTARADPRQDNFSAIGCWIGAPTP